MHTPPPAPPTRAVLAARNMQVGDAPVHRPVRVGHWGNAATLGRGLDLSHAVEAEIGADLECAGRCGHAIAYLARPHSTALGLLRETKVGTSMRRGPRLRTSWRL